MYGMGVGTVVGLRGGTCMHKQCVGVVVDVVVGMSVMSMCGCGSGCGMSVMCMVWV